MRLSTAAAILAIALGLSLATEAGAAVVANGLTLNGLTLNGLTLNGFSTNGLATNGVKSGATQVKGVVLPDGSSVSLK